MKHATALTVGLPILCTVTLVHTYPNKIYIENRTGYKLSFIADYPRTSPKTTAEYWGSHGDRVEKVGPYQNAQIEEANKDKTYAIIKASPIDWEFHPRMSGQRRPVWHKFTFNENSTGPVYLAYDEDTGFAELTQQQWNDRQSGEPRMWGQSDQNATPKTSNSVIEGDDPRTRGPQNTPK